MSRSTERIGRCGEFAVASQLSLISDTVSLVPHGSHADILFEHHNDIYKVQVKTLSKEKLYQKKSGDNYRSGWCFDLRRGKNSKNRTYEEDGEDIVDLYALYCLPYNTIVFVFFDKTPKKVTYTDDEMNKNDSQVSLSLVLKELSLKNKK
tara:strand:- start:964 stop:1413 length:450 start_codon:yes stop_codon:yes gene_type:complete